MGIRNKNIDIILTFKVYHFEHFFIKFIYQNNFTNMIQIDSVQILNFKSIVDYTFSFDSINIDNSKCGIFVGLNESGKSAFLEAMNLIYDGFEDYESYNELCNSKAQEDNDYVELYINYRVLDSDALIKNLLTSKFLDISLIKSIKIKSIERNIYINGEDGPYDTLSFEFEKSINLEGYYLCNVVEIVGSLSYNRPAILKEVPSGQETKKASKNDLDTILTRLLRPRIKNNVLKVQFWKSSSEYLINEEIDLNEFKENPNISVPLKNIFNVYGKLTKDDIKVTLEKALKSPARRDELIEKISESITKHINKIWKEHKIKIRVSINGDKCNVLVEDKDNKFSYFSMNQRSDGFKQFISLILSLSTLNDTSNLKNNLILIDEPEVHLHPSGIAYMRDELLKIAKNNVVLISTHSQFMIDTKNPERQFIVTKNKGETSINQVDENTNFKEDSVIKNAFGLNLFKELLPEKIIIVEGGDDRHFFNHCLGLKNFKSFAIKSAGGASKTPTFAGLLSNEELEPYIILDSDKEGKDNKKKIIDTYKPTYGPKNVFTLKDILNTLPDNSTIEDLYPIDFVINSIHKDSGEKYELVENTAIIIQLKNINEKLKDKQKLEALKIRMSNDFVNEYNTIEKINECEKLSCFLEKLIEKLQ